MRLPRSRQPGLEIRYSPPRVSRNVDEIESSSAPRDPLKSDVAVAGLNVIAFSFGRIGLRRICANARAIGPWILGHLHPSLRSAAVETDALPADAGPATLASTRAGGILVALTIAGLYLGVGVADHAIWSPSEPAFAGVVWELSTGSGLLVPHINGMAYLEKPPLSYWLALSMSRLCGVLNAWVLRLPGVLLGLAGLIVIHAVSKRLHGPTTARLVAILGATTLGYWEVSHRAASDSFAVFFAIAALGIFASSLPVAGEEGPSPSRVRRSDLLLAIVLGISFLAKGVYVPFVAAPPIGVHLFLRGERRRLARLALLSVAVLALIASFWAIALYQAGGWQYVRVAFIDNSIGRAMYARIPPEINSQLLNDACATEGRHPFFYLTVLPLVAAPWICLSGTGLVLLFRRSASSETLAFLRTTLVVVLVLLSIPATKAFSYLLPVLFVLLLASGGALQRSAGAFPVALRIDLVVVSLAIFLIPVFVWQRSGAVAPFLLWVLDAVLLAAVLPPGGWRSRSLLMPALLACGVALGVGLMPFLAALDGEKSDAEFFAQIPPLPRVVATTFADDRRLPLLNFYLRRRLDVIADRDVASSLAAPKPVAVFVGADVLRRIGRELRLIPHQTYVATRGRRAFVLLLNRAAAVR